MITVDDANPTPPFEQVRSQLANLILLSRLKPDERLPTVRQLAADLRLAPSTVARVYRMLEGDGLISTRRGGGTRVSIHIDNYPDILDAAIDFVDTVQSQGLDLESAILAVRAAWDPPATDVS